MKTSVVLAVVFVALSFYAAADTGAITISTVPIGNPGNPPDMRYLDGQHPNGVGSVAYHFRIGKTEVTNSQYVEFLNAVAATDAYRLYSEAMGGSGQGGIVRSGSSGNYAYAIKPPVIVPSGPMAGTTYTFGDKPVVYVTWADAARFANWLHNGQPIGAQDASTTEDGAYPLNGAMTNAALEGVTRNSGARWWIPSEDEWYKAAYHKNDGVSGNYWDYPTASSNTPNDNPPAADTGNSANFVRPPFGADLYPLTDAGAYRFSAGPYGTFDQGGNVFEWNDTALPARQQAGVPGRGIRGGGWYAGLSDLHAARWQSFAPLGIEGGFDRGIGGTGFRVAAVPEPGIVCVAAITLIALVSYRLCRV